MVDRWKVHASMEVILTIDTGFDNPTVELTLYEMDKETELALKDGASFSWPLTMEQDEDTNNFVAVIPCGEIDWSVGDKIWRVISFDDGPENCRNFTSRGLVVEG